MARIRRFQPTVLLLAATSFLADVSGEMLMAVLPFLLVAQGATGLGVGLVGGLTDALGHVVKPVGGYVADRTRRRKPLIVTGYVLASLSRIGVALGGFWMLTLAFRGLDRVGKGLRTAPREALLAESVPRAQRGRAFGLHRAADTAGAFVGVAIALAALTWAGLAASTVVLVAGFVGLLTLVPLAFVRDIPHSPDLTKELIEQPSPRYRAFLVVASVHALANVSYLFFVLRAAAAVGGETGAVALYLLFNLIYATFSYPIARLTERWGKPRILAGGFLLLSGSALLLLLPATPASAIVSFVVLGLSFAAVDATERAFIADLAGSAARGTRLGLFHGAVGVASFAGGLVAGFLWDAIAPWATFAWSAILALVAAVLIAKLGFLDLDAVAPSER